MSERTPETGPSSVGIVQSFPSLLYGGAFLVSMGFALILVPQRQAHLVGMPLLLLGSVLLILAFVAHVMLNQAYWAPKRREERLLLSRLAGKRAGRRQVRVTKLCELELEEGVIKTEVRKEVRKRLPR